MEWIKQLDKSRGSRPRCVLLTDGCKQETAGTLTRVVNHPKDPKVEILPDDIWFPRGKPLQEDGIWNTKPAEEAKLGKLKELLRHRHGDKGDEIGKQLGKWWLVNLRDNLTPNWDIASTCTIERKPGLLLVEAKAHSKELTEPDACKSKTANRKQIGMAIAEATEGLRIATGGQWALSHCSHYQLSNRFAWSWKLASLGVPVVLIYLGFLKAEEMKDQGEPFESATCWKGVLKKYAKDTVDNACWEQRVDVGGTPFLPLIRSEHRPLCPNP